MESWETGPTAYAGPASPVRPGRTELGALATAAGPAPLWLDVLDATIRSCTEHGRPDLAGRLWQRRTQLLDPSLRVLGAAEDVARDLRATRAPSNATIGSLDG